MQVNFAKAPDHNIIILWDKIFEINWIWFVKDNTQARLQLWDR